MPLLSVSVTSLLARDAETAAGDADELPGDPDGDDNEPAATPAEVVRLMPVPELLSVGGESERSPSVDVDDAEPPCSSLVADAAMGMGAVAVVLPAVAGCVVVVVAAAVVVVVVVGAVVVAFEVGDAAAAATDDEDDDVAACSILRMSPERERFMLLYHTPHHSQAGRPATDKQSSIISITFHNNHRDRDGCRS